MTNDARKTQRSLKKQPKEYLTTLLEYLNNVENLIISGQRELAEKVGISAKEFESSEIAMMERGQAQGILMLQNAIRADIKYFSIYSKDNRFPQPKTCLFPRPHK